MQVYGEATLGAPFFKNGPFIVSCEYNVLCDYHERMHVLCLVGNQATLSYLVTITYRFDYIDNYVAKSMSSNPLDLNVSNGRCWFKKMPIRETNEWFLEQTFITVEK